MPWAFTKCSLAESIFVFLGPAALPPLHPGLPLSPPVSAQMPQPAPEARPVERPTPVLHGSQLPGFPGLSLDPCDNALRSACTSSYRWKYKGGQRLREATELSHVPTAGPKPSSRPALSRGAALHALQCASCTGRPQPTPGEAESKPFSVHLLPAYRDRQSGLLPSRRTAHRAPRVPSRPTTSLPPPFPYSWALVWKERLPTTRPPP